MTPRETEPPIDAPEFLRSVYDAVPIGVSVMVLEDPNDLGSFRIIYRNKTGADLAQIPDEVILGKTLREAVPEFLETEAPAQWKMALDTGESVELPSLRYGDELIPDAIWAVQAVPLDARTLAVCFENVTQRHLAQEEARSAHLRLHHLVSAAPNVIYTSKPSGDYAATFVSENVTALVGYEPAQFVDNADFWAEHIHPEDLDRMYEEFASVSSEEALQRAHDELEVQVESRTAELRSANQRLQSELAERQLRESRSQALQKVRDSVWRMESPEDLPTVLANVREGLEVLAVPFEKCGINVVSEPGDQLALKYYNITRDKEVREGTWEVKIDSPDAAIVDEIWRADAPVYRPDLDTEDPLGELEVFKGIAVRKVRSILDVPFVSGTIAVNSSQPNAFSDRDISVLQEMAEVLSEGFHRLQDLRNLAAERERLAVTLQSIGDGVISTDSSGHILLMNSVAQELTGWRQAEATGHPLEEVFHIVDSRSRQRSPNPVDRVMESGRIVGLANHTVLIARDGKERILADSGAPIRNHDGEIIGVVLVFRDITAQEQMESEMLRAEKLESIGVLAGGIAHDFNNLLTGIMGNISLAKLDADTHTKLLGPLEEAEKASRRAADLTQQLLTFSKGGAPLLMAASIAQLIEDSVTFALRGSNVRCEFSIPKDMWATEVDEGQISQVLQNLALNADQAMPEGGLLRVAVENVQLGPRDDVSVPEGRYLKLTICDQGPGIPPEIIPKIFDPYFTTKKSGSGLGLATAYSIIANHSGHISVQSQLGKGTMFLIHLPASPDQLIDQLVEKRSLPVGSGRILVMDDEEHILDLALRSLTQLGYEVILARDGKEAVELYGAARETGEPFAAVILDLTVPGGVSGRDAIQELLRIDPDARAIVSSGYSNDPIMAQFRLYGFVGVVAKPYDVPTLGKVLHDVLIGSQ